MTEQPSCRRPVTYLCVLACAAAALLGAARAPLAQTNEERQSPTLDQIHARPVQQAGGTGSGVTVAVVDTGILDTHPEFAGRILLGYNALERSSDVTDGNGHGTHVSGTIGAAKDGRGMFGVAYEVLLMPIKVLDDDGFGTDASVAAGIRYAVRQNRAASVLPARKPFAINMSLGGGGPSATIENALRSAVRAGMVVAIAAGNSGDRDPEWPALYAAESWAHGQIIAVGAVDSRNRITDFSNLAGAARNFFLVAPGVDVLSTFSEPGPDGLTPGYERLSGTSMATPHVTGAVAALKGGWRYLGAQQVASILFTTAQDLGAPGVDAVYGHGLLDLQAALRPVGPLMVPTPRARVAMSGTSISASPAVRAALAAAGREGRLRVIGFDHFGRDYSVDLAAALQGAGTGGSALAPLFEAVDAAEQRSYSTPGGTLRIASRSHATRFQRDSGAQRLEAGRGDEAFALSRSSADGRELSFGFSALGAQAFGLSSELARRGAAPLAVGLANPYFSLASQHVHAGVGVPLRGGLRIKLGLLLSDPRELARERASGDAARRQRMSWAELSGSSRAALWSLGVGRLQEVDSLLGTVQTGALDFRGRADTTVLSAGIALFPTRRITVGAQYTGGRTAAAANRADSIVSGYTNSRSDAYSVFAALQSPFASGDSLSLTLARPLRASSGAIRARVPVGADESDGSPLFESRSIALAPAGQETRADLLYLRPVSEHTRWFLGMGLRHHPDHDPGARMDWVLGAGVRVTY